MTTIRRLAIAGALFATAPALAQLVGTADLVGPGGAPRGKVILTEAPKGVLVRIEATGLAPGWHAVHFHEKGVCDDAGFKLSGLHVHPGPKLVHGLLNPEASDDGDLPNIYAAADGTTHVDLFTTTVSLSGAGQRHALLDADGSAIVIHATPDDYKTGAGDRVACAVIK